MFNRRVLGADGDLDDGQPPVRTSSLMDSIHEVSAAKVAVISKGIDAPERRWRRTRFVRTDVLVSLIPASAKKICTRPFVNSSKLPNLPGWMMGALDSTCSSVHLSLSVR